jgi:hypothetical protein
VNEAEIECEDANKWREGTVLHETVAKKQKPAMQGLEADVEKRNGEHTALHKAANLSWAATVTVLLEMGSVHWSAGLAKTHGNVFGS